MKKSAYTLTNNHLSISINTKGAELSSIKRNEIEYLWQANPHVWNRHAPILFPIVGRLIDHGYLHNDLKYTMGQHGFARDQDFRMVDQMEDSITFELRSTDELLKVYPFDFILQIKYTLLDSNVRVDYLVKNPSNKEDLLFSIGAHPAFNCPFEKGQQRDEYQLVFDKQIAQEAHLAENNLYDGDLSAPMNDQGIMELPNSVFDRGSLTFNPNPFSKVSFVHKPTGKKYLSVAFENYPYLAIWSVDDASPFICIEPWHGLADNVNHNQVLADKEGIIRLGRGLEFGCFYTIEI